MDLSHFLNRILSRQPRPTAANAAFKGIPMTPDEYCKWMALSPDELRALPEVAASRQAYLSREPLSIIRARRFFAESTS